MNRRRLLKLLGMAAIGAPLAAIAPALETESKVVKMMQGVLSGFRKGRDYSDQYKLRMIGDISRAKLYPKMGWPKS